MDLQECRKEIDRIDAELVRLLNERMDVSREVANYKISVGMPVYDPVREKQKLDGLKEKAPNEMYAASLRGIFEQIMGNSRKLQYTMMPGAGFVRDFTPVPRIPVGAGRKIVFFGLVGSYTEQAMQEFFGDMSLMGYESESVGSFREIMQRVQDGDADYGILPIENTSTGGIDDIYDLLVEYNNIIVGQHILKIDQALVGLPGAKVEELTKVYSHEQGIRQCASFLREHPQIEAEVFGSTSGAAKHVADEQNPKHAAIAGIRAAQVYGLTVLAPAINQEDSNSTRFIAISSKRMYEKDANLISLCLTLPHEEGSLYKILSHIMFNNLNMTKIESRPLPGRPFEYRFFIDFEGNLAEASVLNALRGIEAEAQEMRVLGNYKDV
ncbi:MAG: chorismate mutase [Lachnospiraceae bacterium]|nr:chorismate mutase [Lachnospiraceae bacterium]